MSQHSPLPAASFAVNAEPAEQPGIEPVGGVSTPPEATGHTEHHIPHWLERVELFVRVMLRMYIGIAICYAPWSHTFWDQNPLFLHYPGLGSFAVHGAVRGVVTGLGLLNLWIAFQDALRRRNG